ncbi:MAG: hypothetical protein JXX29_12835 [Deltaproteobacteria bacterium]|nr:hypothetical protein [Deltaproteobacteria bacterium]MBN2672562.1 hypothetical protein [Deltaproteobacteria bacterium]
MKKRIDTNSKTAAELLAELQNDESFVQKTAIKKAQKEQNSREYRQNAMPVLDDLKSAGFHVSNIRELRTKKFKSAIPVLIKWLPNISDVFVKEDIIRTLSVPWAGAAVPVLLREFSSTIDETNTGVRWAIANALEVLADDEIFDELVLLIKNKSLGRSREMLVLALAKMKRRREDSIQLLIDLLADKEVSGYALSALLKYRAKIPASYISPFLNSPQTWIKKDAERYLEILEAD